MPAVAGTVAGFGIKTHAASKPSGNFYNIPPYGNLTLWDVVAGYWRQKKTVKIDRPNRPKLIGAESNPGFGRV